MEKVKQITVIGLGLLGASVTLAVKRSMPTVRTAGYTHRPSTRKKAVELGIADVVCENIEDSVKEADIVILATPICNFEQYFKDISSALKAGCVVTDVGSTKEMAHKWAKKHLRKDVYYVGSHPIAGSEKRGLEFARDDLFNNANCIITSDASTNAKAAKKIQEFWQKLGSVVYGMSPVKHDRILGSISHLPHLMAAALVNASDFEDLKLAGRGFLDTSRIASGPANIWTDIFMTNSKNTARDIDRVIKELTKLKSAIKAQKPDQIEKLLEAARQKREKLISYKVKKGEILI